MALVKCKECGNQVSTDAKSCPSCGAKPPKQGMGLLAKFFLLIVVIMAIGKCASDTSPTSQKPKVEKTPEQVKAEQEKEAQFQRDVLMIKALKAAMKNPASFELVQVIRLENKTLCVTYRGTNSFNAVITEHKAIAKDGSVVDYSRCSGKTGEDVGYIRQAL